MLQSFGMFPVGPWLWCVAHKPKVFGPLSCSRTLKRKHILKYSEVAAECWELHTSS